MARRSRRDCDEAWRPGRESNSGARICSPLRHHSATRPPRGRIANRSVRAGQERQADGGGRGQGDCAQAERGPISRRVFSTRLPRRPSLHERRLRCPARDHGRQPGAHRRRHRLRASRTPCASCRARRCCRRRRPTWPTPTSRWTTRPAAGCLKPRDIGKLLQALRPAPGERALAIAAPYAAAVMEAMGLAVTRLDGEDLTKPDRRLRRGDLRGRGRRGPAGLAGGAGRARRAAGGGAALGPDRAGACSTCAPSSGVGRRDLFDCGPPIMAGFEPQSAFTF